MVLKDSSLFPGVGIVSCGKSWQCRELEERGGGLGLTFAWRTLLMSSWRDLTRVSEYVSNFLILPSFCKHCERRPPNDQKSSQPYLGPFRHQNQALNLI